MKIFWEKAYLLRSWKICCWKFNGPLGYEKFSIENSMDPWVMKYFNELRGHWNFKKYQNTPWKFFKNNIWDFQQFSVSHESYSTQNSMDSCVMENFMTPYILEDTENIHKKFPRRANIFQKNSMAMGLWTIVYEHSMAPGTFECFYKHFNGFCGMFFFGKILKIVLNNFIRS